MVVTREIGLQTRGNGFDNNRAIDYNITREFI